jgi:hypothetical protein
MDQEYKVRFKEPEKKGENEVGRVERKYEEK